MISIRGEGLTLETLVKVARGYEKVRFSEDVKKRIRESQRVLERLLQSKREIYGVTTGVGIWEKVSVGAYGDTPTQLKKIQESPLQKNVILSHMAGAGDLLSEEEVRAAMVLRANVIAKGYSAVRFEIFQTLIELLNRNVIPVVYQKGSLGTSGDLVPLAHIAAVMMGEGEAVFRGRRMKGSLAMKKAGIPLQNFMLRDGIGTINGISVSSGIGGLALFDGFRLLKNALIASSMTLDALQSPLEAFDPRIHRLRPFRGQQIVAETLRRLLTPFRPPLKGGQTGGSQSPITSYQSQNSKVQDAFSLRCIPQILGPSLDALHYVQEQVEIEMNSASDNPLFFPSHTLFTKGGQRGIYRGGKEGESLSGGNFHGQSIAIAFDLFAIAMAEVGCLSERHVNRLLNPHLSGLPGFLVENPGLNSGMMLLQYTASDLVSENRILSHPAVVDNASVSGDQEDHVSMASLSARKARRIVENVQTLLAIEYLCAAQALSFHPLKVPLNKGDKEGVVPLNKGDYRGSIGKGTLAAYNTIRKSVPKLVQDRPLSPDIEKVRRLTDEDKIVKAVENQIGRLKVE